MNQDYQRLRAQLEALRAAIVAAAVKRGIIEEGAPVRDHVQLVELLGMGPVAAQPTVPDRPLKRRAKGWQQCPNCDRLHAELSEDSAFVQAHKAAQSAPK